MDHDPYIVPLKPQGLNSYRAPKYFSGFSDVVFWIRIYVFGLRA